jgi:hypothetical protein
LASPAKIAEFSYDTSLIATTGKYDRLVKIWRRLSSVDQRFEFDYLAHPTVVTGVQWRRPFHRDQSFDNVLYTFCADNILRIWSPGDSHGHHILQLWASIDLMESIQPRTLDPSVKSTRRFAFMIHSRDFTIATERAVQQASGGEEEQLALTHLIEVANRSPEVCVVLDDRGNMSAWGLESVGSKQRKPGDIFNVAHVEGLKLKFRAHPLPEEDNVRFHTFSGGQGSNPFSVIIHHFDGRLEWLEGKLDQFFDPSPQQHRLQFKTMWTGHSNEIKKVVRSATGKAIISRTIDNASIVWTLANTPQGPTIRRSSIVDSHQHIHRAWLLKDGKFIVFLHPDSVSLWDARGMRAVEVARRPYQVKGKPLCLLCIPEIDNDTGLVHLATISSEMKGVSWEVQMPPDHAPQSVHATMEDFDEFDLGSGRDLAFVLPVDPAGTAPVISGFLDTFARDIAISYTLSGDLQSWTARVDLEKRKLEWLVTATVETCIENPALASATSIRKAALINQEQNQLTIWSTKGATLEYEERFRDGHGKIQDLDWSSTPDNQSILAVGFPHKVIVFGQLRFDYLDARPAWCSLREINAKEFTSHPIGDSVWLGGGSFVIGAGNQLFVQDPKINISAELRPDVRTSPADSAGVDIFKLVSRLNGPLPVYHPQYLAQCILSGKLMLVQRILLRLWKCLKFYSDGDPFDSMLGVPVEEFWDEQDMSSSVIKKELHSSYADFSEEEPETVTEEVAASLHELLTSREVPLLSSREQFLLADTIECVGTVEKHRRSLDVNGCRFLLFFRQHSLRESQHIEQEVNLSWREVTWAFHSSSQDILTDLVSRHFHGKMLWRHARESGMFMWMKDLTALVSACFNSCCLLGRLMIATNRELSSRSLLEMSIPNRRTKIQSIAAFITLHSRKRLC